MSVSDANVSSRCVEPIAEAGLNPVMLQVPLKLAWALTIHKCQGLTLDFARISLKVCMRPDPVAQEQCSALRRATLDGHSSSLDTVYFYTGSQVVGEDWTVCRACLRRVRHMWH